MDSMVFGKVETQQSGCRMLTPSIAVKEGWKCTNTDFLAYGQWYCMYNW